MANRREVTRTDAVLIAGAGRAILLQLANPPVGHGVAGHSDFVADPLKRLRHTLMYVYAVVSGTPEQREKVVRLVNHSHATVRSNLAHPVLGPEPESESESESEPELVGRTRSAPTQTAQIGYDANDPGLQLWVAATLYQTTVQVTEIVEGRTLSRQRAAELYRDSQVIGTALHVPIELWPADPDAFAEYWNDMLPRLSVDATTLAVSRQLLYSRSGPWWMRTLMPIARLLTAGFLPESVRDDFELPWSRARYRRFRLMMHCVRVLHPLVPRRVREWPRTKLLEQL